MDAEDEEYEWEDVEEWDVICVDSSANDVLISLKDTGTKEIKPKTRTITKQDREDACLVHRSSVLCLIARTLLMDIVISDKLIQAMALSDVPAGALLSARGDTVDLISALQRLLSAFHGVFGLMPQSLSDGSGMYGTPNTAAHRLLELVFSTRTASPETLVAIFVSALRAMGVPARLVRLLDGAPLNPWLKRMHRLRVTKPPVQSRQSRQKTDAAEALHIARAAASKASGKGKGRTSTEAAKTTKTVNGGKKDGTTAALSGSRSKQPQKKRRKGGGSEEEENIDDGGGEGDGSEAEQARRDRGGESSSGRQDKDNDVSRRNRGEEEFEAQLAMAMQATAVVAAPDKAAKVNVIRKRLKDLMRRPAPSPHDLDASLGPAAPGLVSTLSPGRLPLVWAEVWCGSAEAGRWVHVDVINRLVDRPDTVDTSSARPAPPAYVIAVENGVLRDVTHRYIPNMLSIQRHRDEAWWTETMEKLKGTGSNVPLAQDGNPSQKITDTTGLSQNPEQGGQRQKEAVQNRPSTSGPGRNAVPAKSGKDHAQPSSLAGEALRVAREDAELARRASASLASLPTSVDGFRIHPLYILRRHIGTQQALVPETRALGLHRGEPYYSRSAVSDLRSVIRWRREGREVLESELAKPAKEAKKRMMGNGMRRGADAGGSGPGSSRTYRTSKDAGTSAQAEEVDLAAEDLIGPSLAGDEESKGPASSDMVRLYGHWQTRQWEPPRAVNGRVPRNQHGNVEVPPLLPSLPHGTVHLTLPGLPGICSSLGIDFAPALVGFEMTGGRMVPKLEGVVVCEEISEVVIAAFHEHYAAASAAADERHRAAVLATWRRLLSTARVRLSLQQQDGNRGTEAENDRGITQGDANGSTQEEKAPKKGSDGRRGAKRQRAGSSTVLETSAFGDVREGLALPRSAAVVELADAEVEEL